MNAQIAVFIDGPQDVDSAIHRVNADNYDPGIAIQLSEPGGVDLTVHAPAGQENILALADRFGEIAEGLRDLTHAEGIEQKLRRDAAAAADMYDVPAAEVEGRLRQLVDRYMLHWAELVAERCEPHDSTRRDANGNVPTPVAARDCAAEEVEA